MAGLVPGMHILAPRSRLGRLFFHHRKLQKQIALENREIVVRYNRDDCFTARRAVDGNSFHIVDLIGEISFDHCAAVDHRTLFET
jgi:hypothetical protein